MTERFTQLRWPRWLTVAIAAIVVILLIQMIARLAADGLALLRPVTAPILLSLAFSYLLEPLVGWFERKLKWSRTSASLAAIVLGILLLTFLMTVLLPPIVAQLVASFQSLPEAVHTIGSALQPWLMRLQVRYPAAYSSVLERITLYLSDSSRFSEPVFEWLTGSLRRAVDLGANLLNAILIPLFTFYILTDYAGMREWLESVVPARFRGDLMRLLERIERVTSAFVRGQLLVALILSLLYVVGFFLVRVPLALSLGIVAGFGYLIPYIGTWVAVVLTLVITLLTHPSWLAVFGIAAVYLAIQLLEGFVLTPRLLGGRLRLHPMLVIVGLIVGGKQFGIIGVVLAMPVLAIIKVIIESLLEPYRRSRFFDPGGIQTEDSSSVG